MDILGCRKQRHGEEELEVSKGLMTLIKIALHEMLFIIH